MPLELGTERYRIEQAERTFEDGADVVTRLQHIDRLLFHQLLQTFGERRLAAADRAQQIDDLLTLLEPLCSVPEEADDSLDRLLHAEEVREFGVHLDRAVHEYATEPGLLARINHHRLADRPQHAFGSPRIVGWIVGALAEVILERKLDLSPVLVQPRIEAEDPIVKFHVSPQPCPHSRERTIRDRRFVSSGNLL